MPRTLGWILLAQACGGSAPALTKLALDGLGPWSLVVARQVIGTLILLAMLRLRDRGGSRAPARFSSRDRLRLLVLAWAGFALPQILGALGLTLSTATHGALLIPLEPIGILLGGAIFLREPLTSVRALAIAFGVVGATLIVLPASTDVGSSLAEGDVRGDLLMAAGHLSWAIYTLLAKPLLERHDPLRVSIATTALSVPPLLPLALTEPFDASLALGALGWVLLLALVTSSVGTFAWNRALRSVRTGTMATSIFIQPLVGLGIGALLLGEPIGARAVAGAALIVAGVSWAALRGAR